MQKMISYSIYTKNNEAICLIFIDMSSISGDFRDYKCQTLAARMLSLVCQPPD